MPASRSAWRGGCHSPRTLFGASVRTRGYMQAAPALEWCKTHTIWNVTGLRHAVPTAAISLVAATWSRASRCRLGQCSGSQEALEWNRFCSGVRDRHRIGAFGSAPASIRQMIVAACAGGFHVREPGRPTAAACSASSPKRFLAWTSAPAVMSFLRTRRCAMPCRSRRIEVVCLRRLTSGSRLKTCTCQRR